MDHHSVPANNVPASTNNTSLAQPSGANMSQNEILNLSARWILSWFTSLQLEALNMTREPGQLPYNTLPAPQSHNSLSARLVRLSHDQSLPRIPTPPPPSYNQTSRVQSFLANTRRYPEFTNHSSLPLIDLHTAAGDLPSLPSVPDTTPMHMHLQARVARTRAASTNSSSSASEDEEAHHGDPYADMPGLEHSPQLSERSLSPEPAQIDNDEDEDDESDPYAGMPGLIFTTAPHSPILNPYSITEHPAEDSPPSPSQVPQPSLILDEGHLVSANYDEADDGMSDWGSDLGRHALSSSAADPSASSSSPSLLGLHTRTSTNPARPTAGAATQRPRSETLTAMLARIRYSLDRLQQSEETEDRESDWEDEYDDIPALSSVPPRGNPQWTVSPSSRRDSMIPFTPRPQRRTTATLIRESNEAINRALLLSYLLGNEDDDPPALESVPHRRRTGEGLFGFTPTMEESGPWMAADNKRARVLLDALPQVPGELIGRLMTLEAHGVDEESINAGGCAVCWDAYTSIGDEVKEVEYSPEAHAHSKGVNYFPCMHAFHRRCLEPWLSQRTTCPVCRHDIDPQSATLSLAFNVGRSPYTSRRFTVQGIKPFQPWLEAQEAALGIIVPKPSLDDLD